MASKPPEDPLSKLTKTMMDSAQQVWWSSWSSMLKTQQDLGRHFTDLFQAGTSTVSSARKEDSANLAKVSGDGSEAESVDALAARAFEARLVPLLQREDVASRKEIERLTREVEELTRRVEILCREREGKG